MDLSRLCPFTICENGNWGKERDIGYQNDNYNNNNNDNNNSNNNNYNNINDNNNSINFTMTTLLFLKGNETHRCGPP